MRRRRPSGSLVISCLALFVALGGTSWAAITITSKNVKNNTLMGKDVKNRSLAGADVKGDSLSGRQVKESTLGKVPAAARADNATTAEDATTAGTATNAQKLGGVGPEGFLREANEINGTRAADSVVDYSSGSLIGVGPDEGRYLVHARVAIDNDGSLAELVTCRIRVDDEDRDVLAQHVGPNGNDIRVFSLVALVNQRNPTASMYLTCTNDGGDNDAFRAALYSITAAE